MRALLEIVIKGLVDEPSQVSIEEVEEEGGSTFRITVSERDLGKVIGRDGRIVNAIRQIASSVAARENRWVNVDVVS